MEKRRINVRGIVFWDGKLLAVKHKNKDGSESDYWAVPGGGLDAHELLTDGLVRELMEETGVTAQPGNLLFMQQFGGTYNNKKDYDEELEFFYHVTNPDAFHDIDLSATTHGAEEIARIEFIDPKNEHVLPSFLTQVDIEDVIKKSTAVFLHNEL